ncbi:MAG: CarD family transcriptional regulator, partial [Micropepsaceae bacterium]
MRFSRVYVRTGKICAPRREGNLVERLTAIAREGARLSVSGAPEGFDTYIAVEAAKRSGGLVIFVAADDARASTALEAARFFAPDLSVLHFPAWDCLPYDRVSPRSDIESKRLATLAALAARNQEPSPALVITTVNAVVQRVPPRATVAETSFLVKAGAVVDLEALKRFLTRNSYVRSGTVREPGEYALRGGIVDLWPPGNDDPMRLDFFGSQVETIKYFDAETQRSRDTIPSAELLPASEAPLDPDSISRFRSGYVAAFGAVTDEDPLYAAVSAGRKHAGMEHWLPLFHEKMETLFDYTGRVPTFFTAQAEEALKARLDLVADYYATRKSLRDMESEKGPRKGVSFAAPYKPLKPDALYLTEAEWGKIYSSRTARIFSPFAAPDSLSALDAGGRSGRDFAPERAQEGKGGARVNVFEAAAEHLGALQQKGKRVIVACWSGGSAERMGGVLADHGLSAIKRISEWDECLSLHERAVGLVVLGLEHGFEGPDFAIVTELDVLGERMVRSRARQRRSKNFLAEASSISAGYLVTHIEHGVGSYVGLKTIEVAGAPHDCIELH